MTRNSPVIPADAPRLAFNLADALIRAQELQRGPFLRASREAGVDEAFRALAAALGYRLVPDAQDRFAERMDAHPAVARAGND